MKGLIYRSRYFRVIATGLIFLINIKTSFAGCADTTVGVENKNIILDSSFTASSCYNNRHQPYHGRLTGIPAWAPLDSKLDDPNQYLQIDLGLPYVICAVATQGNSFVYEWVTQYKISLSMDNITWTPYQENGTLKLFAGNTDRSTIKKHNLTQPLARYIRFIPTTYHGHKSMRVGIYGHLRACEKLSIGMESGAIQDGSITASSAQHPAENARLHYTSGSSWCASTSDSDPYLQIDLGSSHLICTVATQGNSMTDQWVKTYEIDTSTDGTTWTTYQENNTDRIFYGNYDRTTVIRRVLYRGIVTRYLVRVVPKTFQTSTPCLRTEIYGYPLQTACSSHSVGIPSTALVPDHRFTATSVYSNDYLPYKGRLGVASAWLARTNTAADHIQVDLGAVFYICAVATQGNGYNNDEYVKKYKVLYSTNNNDWLTYRHSGVEELNGNTDRTTVVTNIIANPFRAKFVRVIPTDYNRYKALRVDFKGLALGCTSSLGLEDSRIPDSYMTSSSFWTDSNGVRYTAPRGRLYGSTAWCSPSPNPTEHIQADLGGVKTVTGIATQGCKTNMWVTSYKVSYSFDNTHWNDYTEGQVVKNLDGNTNSNGVKVNWLRHPIAARYVRITPQTHNSGNRHCLRFDLYGCDIFVVPKVIIDTVDLILPSIKGSSRTLTCSVLGEPAPDIQWFNNGTKINGATQPTLQVQFISAEDVVSKYNCTRQDPNTRALVCNTFYACRATYPNYVLSGGMDEATGKVTVNLNVPKAPTVTAQQNKRSITLSWTTTSSDDIGTISSYNIQLHNQTSVETYSAQHPATNYTIKHLQPNTQYALRMNAISAVGQGLWSSWLNITTLISVPNTGPENMKATKINDTTFLVTWQTLTTAQSNDMVTKYEIILSSSLPKIFTATTQGTQYMLYNLKQCANYTVSVRAYTRFGPGPNSTVRFLTSQPHEPTGVRVVKETATTVELTWEINPPKCQVIQKYTVAVQAANKHAPQYSFAKSYTQNGGQTSLVIKGLRPGTSYEFRVMATTECGQSEKSVPVMATTKDIVPTEYSNSTLWALEGDELTIGCSTNGTNEPITYVWTKPDSWTKSHSLDSSVVRELGLDLIVRGNSLIIRLKSDKELGTYVCTATNSEETVVYRINRVELKKYMARKADTTERSESKAKEVIPYVIPLALINLGLIVCIVYLVYRLRRKEKQHNEKTMKSKTDKTGITNDVMDNLDYADDVIQNSRKSKTAKADEIETPGYMELKPRQSSDTIYEPIQEPANRPRNSEAPHTQDMSGHEQYMDLTARVNTEYEILHHKKNAPGQYYEDIGQGFSRNISSDDTEA